MICSGEALPPELRERFFARLAGRAAQPLRPDRGRGRRHRPGRASRSAAGRSCRSAGPIANTQIYVLDRGCSRCPSACAGELYIGGVQVGARLPQPPRADRRALHPRPVRRRARRAPLPHRRPGALARRRHASSTSAASTHQVKIRGFRIELGEIEAVLAAHGRSRTPSRRPRVADGGGTELAAYVRARQGRGAQRTVMTCSRTSGTTCRST